MPISQFATEVRFIEQGFRLVLDGTTIGDVTKENLLAAWTTAHRDGNPCAERSALQHLLKIQWNWFWLDEWLRLFQTQGRWPYTWWHEKIPQLVSDKDTKSLEEAAIGLLSHSIANRVHACRDANMGFPEFFKTRGWRIISAGCPVEDAIAIERKTTVLLDDWRTWPPFFPGDRSRISAMV